MAWSDSWLGWVFRPIFLNSPRSSMSWTFESVTVSTRNSMAAMFFWSSLPLATGSAPTRAWIAPALNSTISAASMASWGQPYFAPPNCLRMSVPFLPLPTKSRIALQTGWLSGSPL